MNAEQTLSSLLDELIPDCPERGMPGAGALGLGEQLRENVPDIAPLIDAGVQVLHDKAVAFGAASFASLPDADRSALVQALSEEQPMVIPAIQFHLYVAYYANPKVLAGLGMPPRPPHPEGYEMEPNDLGLLEAVRSREKIYRDA